MSKTIAIVALLAAAGSAHAQSYFQSADGTVDFTKAPFADATDPVNWDVITANVAITRGPVQGIYNPLQEAGYTANSSPAGTLWYFGATVQDVIDGVVTPAEFESWQEAHDMFPPGTVGQDAVLYLTAEDAYYDIVFTAWGQGPGSGTNFSYTRAIPAPTSGAPLLLAGLVAARRRR